MLLSKKSLAIALSLLLATDLAPTTYAQNNWRNNRNNNRNNNANGNNNRNNNNVDRNTNNNAGGGGKFGGSRARRCTLYKYDALVAPGPVTIPDKSDCFVEIQIFTDKYPTETSWAVQDRSSNKLVSAGNSFNEQYRNYNSGQRLPTGLYRFRLFDEAKDGMLGGEWTVKVDGKKVGSGDGNFNDEVSVDFRCDGTASTPIDPRSEDNVAEINEEDMWHCFLQDEDDPTAYALSGAGLPNNFIKRNMKKWKSGRVMLDISSGAKFSANSNANANTAGFTSPNSKYKQRAIAKLEVNQDAKVTWRKKKSGNQRQRNGRNLAATGQREVLIVRVSDTFGSAPTQSASGLYNDILGDDFNMATIYEDCSGGQLTFRAARNGNSIIKNGVVDLQLSSESLAGKDAFYVQGLVDDAILANPSVVGGSLSQWDHVFYVFPPQVSFGYGGTLAYAYINGQRSIYADTGSSIPFIAAHELGHNLGLQHSGKTDSSGTFSVYGDKTCLMSNGLPEFFTTTRDLPSMCFNARKNFELGWFEDRTATLDPNSAWKGKLIGVNDYYNDQTVEGEHYVTVMIPGSDGTDLYISYNRKEGITRDLPNDEDADKVVIIAQDTTSTNAPSQNLKSIDVGQSYSFDNKVIEVCERKTGSPDFAEVSVCPSNLSRCSCSNTPTTPSGPAACSNGQKRFQLTLQTDDWGQETSWKILDASGRASVSGSNYDSNTEYKVDQCIDSDSCEFIIDDSYGDGICCDYGRGNFIVSVDGSVVGSGGTFSDRETVDLCPQGTGGNDTPTPNPPSNNCPDGEDEFVLTLTTDDAPEEIKWVIKQGVDPWRGSPVLERRDWGSYTSQGTYIETACLPSDASLMFRILDESRNGGNIYSFSLNGVEIFSSNGNYGRRETTAFQGSAIGAIQQDIQTETDPIDEELMAFISKLERRGRQIPCMRGAAGETCDEDDECCSGTCMDNYRCRAGNGRDVNVYYERRNGNGNGFGNGNGTQSTGRRGGRNGRNGGLRH